MWVPKDLILGGGKRDPVIDYYPVQGRAKIFLVASCYGDRNVLNVRLNGLPGSNADFTLVPL